jgi:hypothetical protein
MNSNKVKVVENLSVALFFIIATLSLTKCTSQQETEHHERSVIEMCIESGESPIKCIDAVHGDTDEN